MYYFIVNPASGSGRGKTIWQAVRAELDRLGIKYRFFLLGKMGEAYKLAHGFSGIKHPVTIVVVGGDGTINEVINGLTSFENITFACIPTGSGNDFVRGLGLAKNPVEALHTILHPKKIRKINIGTAQCFPSGHSRSSEYGRLLHPLSASHSRQAFSFAVSSGIGYDAAVCNAVHDSKLKALLNHFHSGKLVYLLTALWQLLSMKRRTLTVTTSDDKTYTFKNTYFAAAMNLRYEGGGFLFCPNALPDDDCFDLIVAHDISRLEALGLLPLALFGKHVGHKGIHIMRCKKAALQSPTPLCVHTDGEIPGFYDTITWSLRKEKLAVIVR